MFSRRTIQKLIDELDAFVPAASDEIVLRLNLPGRNRLSATWELALLWALSRIGIIQYHLPLPDGRNADVSFSLSNRPEISFVADITAISDAGLHNENPAAEFWDELNRMIRKFGLDPTKFHHQIEARREGAKIKLALPKKGELTQMLKRHVPGFLQKIKSQGLLRSAKLNISEPNFAVTIAYDHNQSFMSGGHLHYRRVEALDQTTLWRSLEAKAKQLRSASTSRGVIICDGGAYLLSDGIRTGDVYSADRIVEKFLRKHSSISFVYLLSARREHGRQMKYKFQGKGWARDSLGKQILSSVICPAIKNLPKPIMEPQNAARWCHSDSYGKGMLGAMSYSLGKNVGRISIPARAVLELLAGRLSPADIDMALHGWSGPGAPKQENPFLRAMENGLMIKKVLVEPAEGKDDDWITFLFSDEPDPAISPFRRSAESREK
jgi:hypothetical protein